MTHTLLFPFSCACLRVVKAGRILVPDPATVHCGQRCDRASVAETHACMFIHTRMHSNSDTETVTCMRGLNDGEIRFISMNFRNTLPLKRASIELKLIASSCNTRTETHGNIIFHYRTNFCMRV